jgi:hypothetical protein
MRTALTTRLTAPLENHAGNSLRRERRDDHEFCG